MSGTTLVSRPRQQRQHPMKHILLIAALCLAAIPLQAQEPAADTGRVYELVQVETRPRPVNVDELRRALEAGYPAELRAAGRSGTVEVSLVVGPDGGTRDVRVVSSTDSAFDSATVAALQVLRFSPAAVEGQPVAVRVSLPIQWQPGSVDGRVYEPAEVDEAPVARNTEAAAERMAELYPPWLRDSGQGGSVTLRLHVDADGDVVDARVKHSTNPQLEAPSVLVGRTLVFTPARVGGRPVAAWTEVPLNWETDAPVEERTASAPQPDTTGAYELRDVAEPPRPINLGTLQAELMRLYPEHLRNTGWRGQVQVRFRVDTQGAISRPVVVQSSNEAFNEPSIRAVRHLRFHPARVGGRPVAVWVELPIEWSAP